MILKKSYLGSSALSFILLLTFIAPAFASDADRVRQLVDVIKSGPSLYRTPEAAAAYARNNPQGGIVAVSTPEGLAAIKQSLRAAISLGDMGDKAKDAVPVLVDIFPQAEDVSITRNAQYGPGVGKFEDWVQTYVISAKNKFLLSSPFMEYQTLTRCEQYVEGSAVTDIHQKKMAGSRIVDANTDIYVTLRINAAACALSKITGSDAGNTHEAWRMWYDRNYGYATSAPAAPVAPAKPTSYITTPANPPLDYVVGAHYRISLSTGDAMVGTVEAVDDATFTIRAENGGRYSYNKSFVRDRALISSPYGQYAPAPSAAPAVQSAVPGSIPYEDLLNFSYSGRMMEVYMNNGNVLRGTLGVVDGSILHLNVDGAEIPISRNVILRISTVTGGADVKTPDNKPTGTSGTATW